MDGLLFDSERIVQRSWEIAGDELGIPHMGDVIYHTLGMNRAGRNEYFRKYIREDFPFEEFGKLTRDNILNHTLGSFIVWEFFRLSDFSQS